MYCFYRLIILITFFIPFIFPDNASAQSFPKPNFDTGVGMHWGDEEHNYTAAEATNAICPLKDMGVSWIKIVTRKKKTDSAPIPDNAVDFARIMKSNDIEPIVRLFRPEPLPNSLPPEALDAIPKYVSAGVSYFESTNEPNISWEWAGGSIPDCNTAVDQSMNSWVKDALNIQLRGGIPIFPALSPGGDCDDVLFLENSLNWINGHTCALADGGPNDNCKFLFDASRSRNLPAVMGIHNYSWNHDNSMSGGVIDFWTGDSNGFLKFIKYNEIINNYLGKSIPILGTEDGNIYDNYQDPSSGRPRTDYNWHRDVTVGIANYQMSNSYPNFYNTAFWLALPDPTSGRWGKAPFFNLDMSPALPLTIDALKALPKKSRDGTPAPGACRVAPPPPAEGFVQRSGSQLTLGGNPYRFLGVNIWGLVGKEPMHIQEALNYLTSSCGINVIRVFGTINQGGGTTSGAIDAIKKVLDIGGPLGIRFVIPLADIASPELDDNIPDDFYPNPKGWYESGYRDRYKSYAESVVSALKDRPEILAWELANEPHCNGHEECRPHFHNWVLDMSQTIKRADPNHLVSIGTMANQNTSFGDSLSNDDYKNNNAVSSIDLPTGHYYNSSDLKVLDLIEFNKQKHDFMLKEIQVATSLSKPFYIGEAGFLCNGIPNAEGKPNCTTATDAGEENRARIIGKEIDDFFGAGTKGYLVWQFSGPLPPGGVGPLIFENDPFSFFERSPSPICQILKTKAASLGIIPVPPGGPCKCKYTKECSLPGGDKGVEVCSGVYSGSACAEDSSGACAPACTACAAIFKVGPDPAGLAQIRETLKNVISAMVVLAFMVLFVMLIRGGFQYLTSGGEPKTIQSAHHTITWAFLGVLFLAIAWLVLRLVEAFTGIPVTQFDIGILL